MQVAIVYYIFVSFCLLVQKRGLFEELDFILPIRAIYKAFKSSDWLKKKRPFRRTTSYLDMQTGYLRQKAGRWREWQVLSSFATGLVLVEEAVRFNHKNQSLKTVMDYWSVLTLYGLLYLCTLLLENHVTLNYRW